MDVALSGLALILLRRCDSVCIGLLLTASFTCSIFRADRTYNRRFKIWKFATMLKNSPSFAGGLHTTRRDPRCYRWGAFCA